MSDKHKKWTSKWPDTKGTYWFYGQRFGDGKKELFYVEAWVMGQGSNESIAIVGNGHFWYKSENHIGQWKRVEPPTLPTE